MPLILGKHTQCHLHASDKTTSFGCYCFILRALKASYWRLVTSFLLSTQCLSLQDRVELIPLLIKMHAFTSDNSYLECCKWCNLQKFDPFSPTWKLPAYSTQILIFNLWFECPNLLLFFFLFCLFYGSSEGRRQVRLISCTPCLPLNLQKTPLYLDVLSSPCQLKKIIYTGLTFCFT